jgi:transposase
LQRFGKHLVVNHSKEFVNKTTKNHINGIEEFWSYARHILYNFRGVSRYHFPMYLKEIKYCYNHRKENVLKLILQLYFGYVLP